MPIPRTRGDCANGPRPCSWTACRHHLAGTVRGTPGESCTLDVADRGGATLEEISRALGVTRERVRQIEEAGLAHLREKVPGMPLGDFQPPQVSGRASARARRRA